MLTLFNRAELLVTCDMIRLAGKLWLPLTSIISAEPRTCLAAGGIPPALAWAPGPGWSIRSM